MVDEAVEVALLAAADVLDASVLDALRQLRGKAQPEFVDHIIALFMETALTLIAELKNGLAKRDIALLHRASHALKACSASIGAASLSARCKELESAARAGSVADASAHVSAIAGEYARVEAVLIRRLAEPRAAQTETATPLYDANP